MQKPGSLSLYYRVQFHSIQYTTQKIVFQTIKQFWWCTTKEKSNLLLSVYFQGILKDKIGLFFLQPSFKYYLSLLSVQTWNYQKLAVTYF